MTENRELKPLGLGGSLLFFGIPAAALAICFHWLRPVLENLGLFPFYAYLISLGIPLVLALIASFVALKLEGYPISRQSVIERFRVKKMDWKTWLWSILIFLMAGGITSVLSGVSMSLIKQGIIPIPNNLPAFMDPTSGVNGLEAMDQAVGGLAGNFLPAISLFIILVFNIVGEEFWWRGVVLPRQELAFGKWAWLIHGLMWNLFHVFKWWDLLGLLPVTLLLSYYCSRKKNTSPGILIHSLYNGIGLIPMILGALAG